MSDEPYWNADGHGQGAERPGGAGGDRGGRIEEPSGPAPVPPGDSAGSGAAGGLGPARFGGGGDALVTDSFEGWWTASMAVVRRSWRSIGLILLVGVVLPRWVLGAYGSLTAPDGRGQGAGLSEVAAGFWPGAAAAAVGGVLSLVLLYLAGSAALAAVRTAAAEAAGGFLSVGEAFGYGFARGVTFWLWLLLAWVTVAVGTVLCVLPGLWAAFALSLMAPAAVFEPRRSPYLHSIALTHSAFWGALGRLIMVVLTVFAANVVVGALGALLAALWRQLADGRIASVLTVATEAVMSLLLLVPMIWALGAALCTYAWLRGRRESVSATSLSAEAAGVSAAAPGGAPTT